MNNVFVTGGIGNVGRATVARLLAQGDSVRILDRVPEADARAAEHAARYAAAGYVQGDINDYPDLLEKIRGCDQIIHLAALAAPSMGTPQEVFRINTGGTFNVFRAAEELGIRRVVQASSINALGLNYGKIPAEPVYFPIDEDHPLQTTDAYSFSKGVVEEIGAYYWRRAGISSVALRFPAVLPQDAHKWLDQFRPMVHAGLDKIFSMPPAEQRAWVDGFLAEIGALHRQGKLEDREFTHSLWGPNPPVSQEVSWLWGKRNNFWTLIDERDAAQALVKGLSADYEGAHPLFVMDAVNSDDVDSETLARVFFPDVQGRTRPMVGNESMVSIQRARDLIGFVPEYSFGA